MDYLAEPSTGSAPDNDPPFRHPSDEFIDAFSGCCASLAVLLNTLDALDPPESIDASSEIVYHLCLVAGTMGYGISGELTAEP
jgi:hypothetical protein